MKQSVSHGLADDLAVKDRLGAFGSKEAFLKEVERRTRRWHLCEKCDEDVQAWRFGPSTEFLQARLEAQQRRTAKQVLELRERREFFVRPLGILGVLGIIIQRLFALVLLLFALDLAFENIPLAFQVPITFEHVTLGPMGLSARPTHVAVGFAALGLALVAFNTLFAKPRGRGPIDGLFWFWGRNADDAWRLPLTPPKWLIGLWALFLLIGVAFHHRYHFSAEAAVAAIRENKLEGRLSDSSRLLFARNEDGVNHITRITPDLVRALDQANIDVQPFREEPNELPTPGFMPFILLIAFTCWQWLYKDWIRNAHQFSAWSALDWKDIRWRETRRVQRTLVIAFGLVNLYVVAWLVSGEGGICTSHGTIHPLWVRQMSFLLFCGLAFLLGVIHKVEDPRHPLSVRAGWGGLFFGLNVVILVLIAAQSGCSVGNPAIFWTMLWILAGALCWRVSVPWEALEAQ